MIYDCTSADKRSAAPVRDWGAGCMLSERMLEKQGKPIADRAPGERGPYQKDLHTQPGPYMTDRLELQTKWADSSFATHKGVSDETLILFNAESASAKLTDPSDPRIRYDAQALAVSLKAIQENSPSSKVAPYWWFNWDGPDAQERWGIYRQAFANHGVWPAYCVISGHFVSRTDLTRSGTTIALVDRIRRAVSIVRKVEPWAPIAVLTCPHTREGRPVPTLVLDHLSDQIGDMGFDEIRWYQPELTGPLGGQRGVSTGSS